MIIQGGYRLSSRLDGHFSLAAQKLLLCFFLIIRCVGLFTSYRFIMGCLSVNDFFFVSPRMIRRVRKFLFKFNSRLLIILHLSSPLLNGLPKDVMVARLF